MFDIGFWELLLIAIVGLLVLGPERLPSAIRGFQRMLSGVRQYTQKVQSELDHELRIKELHEHLKQAESQDLENLSPELQRSLVELRNAAADVQRPYSKKSDDSNSSNTSDKSKDTE
ncbi:MULTISPECIES: Sec-independent protein translocase protein TatB [Idiomarina]|jgi:sec-independent protein translocase protein TatB|uniref:Sec-independent protein translocase protein TatB n=2 Tax=Idiomarina TaxID=135575 RepID=A0A837NFI0_9GAMM|nr:MULTISPECIES: Sec-independent protein translocase protein TatB [Idiomarina]KTG24533.1 translocase [Idiomarina sp. H105]OAE93039.1 translocase [Idiomarina sp. WRN-38]KPD23976.1 translocase [Idiomarina zobellii]MCH2456122.1 Sec-independent protein translocase protein TatB [Idiomarina sp.]MCJ8317159.1 Sec-independent protein translocase protein TatB [Idiomarina sp.]|tara:strand:+ start:104138 stop:104488 length:351 start_codon:yes stop_codon:yes gene_type:complete